MKSNVGGSNGLVISYAYLKIYAPAKQALAEARKPYKKISGGQPTIWLSTIKKDFSEMTYNLKEAFEIAYDRDIYTQLVCRAVSRSHQADWRRKRRLKEETAGRN